MMVAQRVDVVILTHNRKHEALRTIERMQAADAVGTIVVVDNASTDATTEAIARRFPGVLTVRLPRNVGAAARNFGVRETRAPYVAFCDDDTWWSARSLRRAATVLDAFPPIGVITGRVLVGDTEADDPTNERMRCSPFANDLALPGSEVFGFLAGACVFRRRAFLQTGGYHPRFFIGGEEALIAIDLKVAGWRMAYVPDVTVHHHPSTARNAGARSRLLIRNALWSAWLRRPLHNALVESARQLAKADFADAASAFASALRGLPWIVRERRVVPPDVERAIQKRDAFDAQFQYDGSSLPSSRVFNPDAGVPIDADIPAHKNGGRSPAFRP